MDSSSTTGHAGPCLLAAIVTLLSSGCGSEVFIAGGAGVTSSSTDMGGSSGASSAGGATGTGTGGTTSSSGGTEGGGGSGADCGSGGPGSTVWSKVFGGQMSHAAGSSVATDATGNVVVTGGMSGTVDFGGGPLSSTGGGAVFVAKYNPNGEHLWSTSYGGQGNAAGHSITIDGTGDVLTTGTFMVAIDPGGGTFTSAGNGDVFIAKHDANGTHLWSKSFGGLMSDYGNEVTIDEAGNVLVSGSFKESVDLGAGPLTSAGGSDVFVVKYHPNGTHVWSKRFGGPGDDTSHAITTDSAGEVLLTGSFQNTIDLGGGPLDGVGVQDIFVAALGPSDDHLWSKSYGGPGNAAGKSLVVNAAGVIVAGGFSDSVDFGGDLLTSPTNADLVFLAALDSGGGHLWSKGFSTALTIIDVAAVTGGAVATGTFFGSLDLGGEQLWTDSASGFAAHYDPSGKHLWSRSFGAPPSLIYVESVTAAGAETAFITGEFMGTVDFGCGPLTNVGIHDAFVVKLRL